MKFQIYRTRAKQWRWRLRADNGEIIAHGESYKRKWDCVNAVALVRLAGTRAQVEIPDK